MTKAERIFNETHYQCKKYMDIWGYQTNPNGAAVGFNGLCCEDVVYIRTINAVAKILSNKKRSLEIDKKLKISTSEKLNREMQILNMVESTLDNNRKSLERFNEN